MRSRLLALAFFTALFASHAFAQPTATITHIGPPKHALLGTDVTFCLRFENTGNAVGYGPYIDLLLDDGGGSAVPLCDGLSYVSAALVHTNPSLPLNAIATPQIAPPCGTATTFTHPWGNPPPSSTTGKEFVRLELPFGSFQNGQEPLDIEVTAHIDAQADVGTALTFEARGDYRWTPLPLSPWVTQTVTPEVVMIEKKFLGAENESVPGPNFPGKYEITIDVAGQIANATLKDCATPGVVFSSTGTNCFTQNWTSLSGHNVLTPSFTITQPPAIPMPSCRITLNNRAELVAGTWTPAPPDPPINFANVPYPFGQVTIDQKAMAIQKSVTGNPVPGGSLAYRLDFQVSDYHRFRDIVVTDVLSDGQALSGGITLSVSDRFGSFNGPLPPACLTTLKNVQKKYVCPPGKKEPCSPNPQSTIVGMSGGLQLNIDVSCAMKSPPFQNYPFRSGVLSGGEVPLPGGGGPAATGFITFSASINDQFTYPHPPGDPFIDKHDPLLNAAAIRGNLASNANVKNPPAIGPSCGDDSYTCLSVPGDTLTKIVYAKNGVVLNPLPAPTGTPLPRFTRGDTITYRLSKTIPTGDAEDVRITDWFPLPMLPVPTLLPAIGACTGLPPTAAAIACSVAPVAPQMTYVAPNALEFNFGTFNNTANTPQTFEVYVTLTVSNDPRPDGLFLTNHARECEKNTFGVKFCQTAIAQFELTEPLMRIRKGVICPTPNCPEINPSSDIALPDTARIGIDDPIVIAGPIKTTWKCAPPLTCPMFAGIITGIATPLLNTSSVNVDANDEVTFAIVAENGGNGPYGAYGVTIGDTLSGLPATFVAGSLCVRRGDGATIPYTSGSPFPITLTTPLPPPSAGAAKNVVVITFRVKMPGNNKAEIGKCLDNTASIKFYTNMPGGQNFVTSGLVAPGSSVASACVKPKELTKSIVATSETHTPSLQVTIGEIVRYRLHLQIPEGYTNTLSLSDLLPTGLKYLGPPSYTWIPAAMGVPQSPVWNPQQLTLSFSPVSNNSQNTAACEFLNAEFPALVQNISTNINGVTLANGFSASATAGALGTFVATPATTVTVVEPHITIAKSAAPASVGPGGLVSYTVTLTSDGTSDAFDIKLNDLVPPSLINVMPNPAVMNPPGCATFTAPAAGNTVTSTSIKMPKKPAIGPMCSATFTIHGQLAPGICPPKVTNIATVTWTSLPGPKGTGNVTPGASGAVDGERIYNASASADFACVNASHCDFWIKKSGTKQQTPIGTLVTYTITVGVTPPGIDCPCSPIQIIDALPTQLGNITVGPDPQYWSHTLVGNTLTLSTTKQPPPMPATFTVSGYMTAVPPPPTLQNCARILCNDPNPADNSSCATLTFP